jgi:hypothetical protein
MTNVFRANVTEVIDSTKGPSTRLRTVEACVCEGCDAAREGSRLVNSGSREDIGVGII